MLTHIQLVRNLGSFDSVAPGAAVPFNGFTLVYAENGRGKTTVIKKSHFSPLYVRKAEEREMMLPEGAMPRRLRERSGVTHMRRAPAVTYAMEIDGAKQPEFKIELQVRLGRLKVLIIGNIYVTLWDGRQGVSDVGRQEPVRLLV